MGHQHKGDAQLALKGLQFDLHLAAKLAVKGGKRFVQKQHLGFVHDGPRQGHALLLAARHFPDPARAEPRQPHHVKHPVHLARHLGPVRARPALQKAIGDVVGHAQVREKRIVLEHHVHRALVGRNVGDLFPVQIDLARGWHLEPRQHPQRGGLATA